MCLCVCQLSFLIRTVHTFGGGKIGEGGGGSLGLECCTFLVSGF